MSEREQRWADPIMFWLIQYSEIENTWERYTRIYFLLLKPSKTINSLHLCSLEGDFIRSNESIRSFISYYQNLKIAGSLNQTTFLTFSEGKNFMNVYFFFILSFYLYLVRSIKTHITAPNLNCRVSELTTKVPCVFHKCFNYLYIGSITY
jgi:hypothetical protein